MKLVKKDPGPPSILKQQSAWQGQPQSADHVARRAAVIGFIVSTYYLGRTAGAFNDYQYCGPILLVLRMHHIPRIYLTKILAMTMTMTYMHIIYIYIHHVT